MNVSKIKSTKYVDVQFLDGSIEQDGVIYPVMNVVKVPTEGIRMYGEVFLRMSQLEPCSEMFYLWLIMEMPESMIVITDKFQRERFLKYAKHLGASYKNISIQRAITSLVRLKFMVRIHNNRFMINPEFCFKGTDRLRYIKDFRRNIKVNLEAEIGDNEEITIKEK